VRVSVREDRVSLHAAVRRVGGPSLTSPLPPPSCLLQSALQRSETRCGRLSALVQQLQSQVTDDLSGNPSVMSILGGAGMLY
jgi:hypothetical protein